MYSQAIKNSITPIKCTLSAAKNDEYYKLLPVLLLNMCWDRIPFHVAIAVLFIRLHEYVRNAQVSVVMLEVWSLCSDVVHICSGHIRMFLVAQLYKCLHASDIFCSASKWRTQRKDLCIFISSIECLPEVVILNFIFPIFYTLTSFIVLLFN